MTNSDLHSIFGIQRLQLRGQGLLSMPVDYSRFDSIVDSDEDESGPGNLERPGAALMVAQPAVTS